MWIFGYGSLVFRPGFPYLQRHPATIEGWARRWWQASPDHRGTAVHPGRVVTLERSDATCWGVAYQIDTTVSDRVLAELDHREKAGYARHHVELHICEPAGSHAVRQGLVYVAGPTNENFLGPADPDEMARHIAHSQGPSGANSDYLLQLADALRAMGATDRDTFDLEERIRQILHRGS